MVDNGETDSGDAPEGNSSPAARRSRSVRVSGRYGGAQIVELEVKRRNPARGMKKLQIDSAFSSSIPNSVPREDVSNSAGVTSADLMASEKKVDNVVKKSSETKDDAVSQEAKVYVTQSSYDEKKSENQDSYDSGEEEVIKSAKKEVNSSSTNAVSDKESSSSVVDLDLPKEASLEKSVKVKDDNYNASHLGKKSKARTVQKNAKSSKQKMMDYITPDMVDSEIRGDVIGIRSRAKERTKKRSDVSVERKYTVNIKGNSTVKYLANSMKVKEKEVLRYVVKEFSLNIGLHDDLGADIAELVVNHFGHNVNIINIDRMSDVIEEHKKIYNGMKREKRPPVVTIMGHVDHGKTSLLDKLRSSGIVDGEYGGITQHIGAYQISCAEGDITFVDTPGHAAFTEMRARGAQVTDIVILVVAADDGIKAQTIEAIHHAKAAGVPIIVAINKIDKPAANVDMVKSELYAHDLIPDDAGGDTLVVPISVKDGTNIESLLEAIFLQASMLDLVACPVGKAMGVVIESKIDAKRGGLVTVMVKEGKLRVGDIIVAGASQGRVRAMHDSSGISHKFALPSQAVEILGFNIPPKSGEIFMVMDNDRAAREVVNLYHESERNKAESLSENNVVDPSSNDLSSLFSSQEDDVKALRVIIKGDVDGSVEAIRSSLEKVMSDDSFVDLKVNLEILHSAIGQVSDSDIVLAEASNAMIVGFNVKVENRIEKLSRQKNVTIRCYNIIYELIDDIKYSMLKLSDPVYHEEVSAVAEVRAVFELVKRGNIAGCYIVSGVVKRGDLVRLVRNDEVIYKGNVSTLRHYKEVVREVKQGSECGIGLSKFNEIKVGDKLEMYKLVEKELVLK